MVSFSAINDFALLPIARAEEDMEDLYTDDFFLLHERGVDFIFIFLYMHLLRKIYLKAYYFLQMSAWKSGSLMFLLLHGIIFFGLVLCCTHLSDITLKIAANVVNTLTFKYMQLGYWLFTDNTLNTDTLIRLMYLHYVLPFILFLISFLHLLDMHYGWKDKNSVSRNKITFSWLTDIFKNEILVLTVVYFILNCFTFYIYPSNEPLSYELFMWGDLGFITDIRFLGVAPHWYFRAYMGWLIFCPHHYIGIYGLLLFFLSVYFQPELNRIIISVLKTIKSLKNSDNSTISNQINLIFTLNLIYAGSYLPCGKYFTAIEGNIATMVAFLVIFTCLLLPVSNIITNKIEALFTTTTLTLLKIKPGTRKSFPVFICIKTIMMKT